MSEVLWLTNPDDSLHVHMDITWACCQNALRRAESLNMRILSETGSSTPEAYKQQWTYEGNLFREMVNPLIGYEDPFYDNNDPNADVD